ncbi:hypothetical protein KJ780_03325 [Candidatus Micrarchaeota archaeon]|nr:hypothetical protein [Candidatus Micrarchaeota archaeon]
MYRPIRWNFDNIMEIDRSANLSAIIKYFEYESVYYDELNAIMNATGSANIADLLGKSGEEVRKGAREIVK